ncbi:GGDEF domain-containing protein [Rhodococcus sp. BP-332]|uniref:GGDEF domain-containing protein n=1 Tax=Rhodococcus sp. BP-332 TaxID=2739447 RepID=UPI001C9AF07D|nr:GGDEF domain-containing protein [Rhodococcus sp. BP-332]MBY6677680.1 GGDEF domain-containing protein [Rhodococcus sp. BP-332]
MTPHIDRAHRGARTSPTESPLETPARQVLDIRSIAMGTAITGSALSLGAGWVVPGLFFPGIAPMLATALAVAAAVVGAGIIRRSGRLTERQFVAMGMVMLCGTTFSAVAVTDPAGSLAIAALLTIVPVLSAAASPPATAWSFTVAAGGAAVVVSFASAGSAAIAFISAGASLTIVVVPVVLVWGLRRSMVRVSHRFDVLARTDVLTGLLNRRGVLPRLTELLGAAASRHESVTTLVIDIDNFKAVNDTHGHTHGDRTLQSVARAVVLATPAGAVVSRLGGEEFLVVARGARTADLADRVLRSVRTRCSVTVSIGTTTAVATAPDGAALALGDVESTLDSFISCADDAMYRAKRLGRDRVEHGDTTRFHPPSLLRARSSEHLRSRRRQAVQRRARTEAAAAVAATLVALQTRGHGPEHTSVRLAMLSRRLETEIDVATTSRSDRYSAALRSAAALDQSIGMAMEHLAVDRDTAAALLQSAAHAEGTSLGALCRALASLADENPAAAARYLTATARESP